jgi:putative DNA primase/helicase
MSTAVLTIAEAAIDAARNGWHVMAVKPNHKDPFFPLAPRAYLSATDDPETVKEWFTKHPRINYGIACAPSGLVVLDFDYRNMTDEAEALADDLREFPTRTVQTGDGFHLYYRAQELPQRVPGKVCGGVDVKYRGYVVGAGSIHANGNAYTVTDGREPQGIPAWVLGG